MISELVERESTNVLDWGDTSLPRRSLRPGTDRVFPNEVEVVMEEFLDDIELRDDGCDDPRDIDIMEDEFEDGYLEMRGDLDSDISLGN